MSEKIASLYADIGAKNALSPALKTAKGDLGAFKSSVGSALQGLTGFSLGSIGAAAGIGILGNTLRQAVGRLGELQRLEVQTNAVIKSTGGVAGVTADQVIRYANAMERTSLFEAEAVQNAENVLLTFTKIGGSTFPQATQAIVDMATAMGGDLQGAAIQVGKALQDPILGVTALRRVGVNFNGAQTEVIKKLVETGRAAEAQQLILKELNTEFGGSAAAQVDTYAGQMHVLKETVESVTESIMVGLMPALTEGARGAAEAIDLNMRATQLLNSTIDMEAKPTLIEYIKQWHLFEEALRGSIGVEETGIIKTGMLAGSMGAAAGNTNGLVGALGGLPDAMATAEAAFKDQTESTVEGYLKSLEYKAGIDDIEAAIAALRDKHVTVTITTVTDEIARQTWQWREELAKPDTECFVAGTLVAMADGTAMPIEDVRVGDGVQSYDEKAGIFVPSIVLAELPAVEDHINALRFSDGSTIHVTDRHHFLTNREWVPADELVEGDEMVGLSNGVRFLTRTRTVGAVEVFNLEIAITHIYVAGGLVVHNAKGKASGADFIVPPGYPNDSYPMRVQSGEHVQVTPAGEKPTGSGNTVIMTNYIADSISEDALLAALARIAH